MQRLVEKQYLRENRPVFILLFLAVGTPVVALLAGINRGPALDNNQILSLSLTLLVLVITLGLLFRAQTFLQIEPDKLSFRSPLVFGRMRFIDKNDVQHWEIVKHKWHHGFGLKVRPDSRQVYVLKPGNALIIETTSGKNYRFGINRPAAVKRFIETHWKRNEERYG